MGGFRPLLTLSAYLLLSSLSPAAVARDEITDAPALLKEVESRIYFPTERGLKSLVIAVESEDFKDMVKEYRPGLPFTPFVIYSYRGPSHESISVSGVPPTHPALIEKIEGIFEGMGWLLLPLPFSKQMKDYDLLVEDGVEEGEVVIKGRLKEKKGDLAPQISLFISRDGLPEKMESRQKRGVRIRADYRFSKKEGESFYFLTDVSTRIDDGFSTTLTTDNLSYRKVDSFFLVEKIIEKIIIDGKRTARFEMDIRGYKINE